MKSVFPGSVGARYEHAAERFLRRHGLRTLCRNYRSRLGELDLVMDDAGVVVFVEVRFRSDDSYGDPLATITPAKQRRVIRAASMFLLQHPEYEASACRFDAVGVTRNGARVEFDWIKNAFST